MNLITITGNLTNDPQIRYTNDGRPVVNFAVAVNRRVRSANGDWEDELEGYFDCSAWDTQATQIASLAKGQRVIVTGRMVQRKYIDREGNDRVAWGIDVREAGPSLKFAPRAPQGMPTGPDPVPGALPQPNDQTAF